MLIVVIVVLIVVLIVVIVVVTTQTQCCVRHNTDIQRYQLLTNPSRVSPDVSNYTTQHIITMAALKRNHH